jgi:hypothetical protein
VSEAGAARWGGWAVILRNIHWNPRTGKVWSTPVSPNERFPGEARPAGPLPRPIRVVALGSRLWRSEWVMVSMRLPFEEDVV